MNYYNAKLIERKINEFIEDRFKDKEYKIGCYSFCDDSDVYYPTIYVQHNRYSYEYEIASVKEGYAICLLIDETYNLAKENHV